MIHLRTVKRNVTLPDWGAQDNTLALHITDRMPRAVVNCDTMMLERPRLTVDMLASKVVTAPPVHGVTRAGVGVLMSESTRDRNTRWLPTDDARQREQSIHMAAEILLAGGVVAFPTETVYGLGADATNVEAVERIFAAKERPHTDPLIVHIADVSWLPLVTDGASALARRLGERFWPGPLTLVTPRSPAIPALVSAGGPTVGVRVPAHPVALALIRAVGRPLAAPSANRFMHTSPTTAEHVLLDLNGRIDAILDGGPCVVGVESTVLDTLSVPPRILRPGGITLEALQEYEPSISGPTGREDLPAATPAAAPGQMERHYAPHTPLYVFDAQGAVAVDAIARRAMKEMSQGKRVGALVPDEEVAALSNLGVIVEALGPSADLAAITRNFYAALRRLDVAALDVLYSHTLGHAGLGLALRDRLRRAAGGDFSSLETQD